MNIDANKANSGDIVMRVRVEAINYYERTDESGERKLIAVHKISDNPQQWRSFEISKIEYHMTGADAAEAAMDRFLPPKERCKSCGLKTGHRAKCKLVLR